MTEIPQDTETVWIGYRDYGYEGKSEPLRAFASEELANVWLMGVDDSYGGSAKICELPIIRSSTTTSPK